MQKRVAELEAEIERRTNLLHDDEECGKRIDELEQQLAHYKESYAELCQESCMHEDRNKLLRTALALHHSMVLCGESPSDQSEAMFREAMAIVDASKR